MDTRVTLAMLRGCIAVAIVVLPAVASAEPFLAQREGYRCSQCHVNRTGGGKRTPFGHQYALTHMTLVSSGPARDARSGAEPRRRAAFWRAIDPQITDWFSVGANLRVNHTTIFANKIHNSFENPEASLYAQLDATQFLTAYVDVSFAQGAVEAREAFVLLHAWGLSLKGGVLLPPFGLRIWGDGEFIRQMTGYNFASPELGAELGYERGGFGAFFAVTNGSGPGSDSDNGKKLSLWLEYAHRYFRVGLSGSYNKTAAIRQTMGGLYAGFRLGRLTLLGEADVIAAHYYASRANLYSLVAYAEGNFLVRRGINLKVAYGYHDPDLQASEDQRLSVRGGIEIAPMPFVILGVYYRLGRSVPQDEVGNASSIVAELHVYM